MRQPTGLRKKGQPPILILAALCTVVVTVGVLGGLWSGSKRRAQITPLDSGEQPLITGVSPSRQGSRGVERAQNAERLKARKAMRMSEMTLPLPSMPFIDRGDHLEVRLEVRVREMCMVGDADVIASDLRARPDARLLLTVEPLDKGQPLFSEAIPLPKVDSPAVRSIKIPKRDAMVDYGVFLCLSEASETWCKGRAADDMGKLAGLVAKGKTAPATAIGRIYMFHHMAVTSRRVMFGDQRSLPAAKDALLAYHAKYSQDQAGSDQILAGAIQLASRAGSMPGVAGKERVVLELPAISAICAKGSLTAHPSALLTRPQRKGSRP